MRRGQLRKTFGVGGLLLMLAAIGCGGSGSSSTAASSTTPTASVASTSSTSSTPTSTTATSTSTSTAEEKVPTIDLPLASSAKLEPISARYTCDGANTSLPISWSQVPTTHCRNRGVRLQFPARARQTLRRLGRRGPETLTARTLRWPAPRGGDRRTQRFRADALLDLPRQRRGHTLCLPAVCPSASNRGQAGIQRQRTARKGPALQPNTRGCSPSPIGGTENQIHTTRTRPKPGSSQGHRHG